MAIEEKIGFCALCRSHCGTINVVESNRLVAVKPNPAHPTGRALCPKGRAAPEIAHSARRLTVPLRRTKPKAGSDPGFVAISWDEALEEIAERMATHRRESGAHSIAFAVTSGSSSATSDSLDWILRFIRGFGSPNTCISTEVCNWHKDHAHAFTFGCGLPTADYRQSDLILLWGHNPASVWLAQAEAISAARRRGARVAVIDPRRAGLARDADLWLRIRPGTDAALALGLARQVMADGSFDNEFVRDWTNAPYLVREDSGRFLRGVDLGWVDAPEAYVVWDETIGAAPATTHSPMVHAALRGPRTVIGHGGSIACRTAFDRYIEAAEPYDLGVVERITGIDAVQIAALASAIGESSSVSYHGWTGLAQHTNATQTERAVATLYALTGCFDAPGGNVLMTAPSVPALHSVAMIPPELRSKALGLDARPLGPPAEGWITPADLYTAIIEHRPYAVRTLFGFGSNLLVSHPNPERGRKALQALEFQVHCDLFLNPTAAYADIVLPVSSAWEREALRVGFEITPEAQELVQLRQPVISPQGQARSDMAIVFELAQRLGMVDLFFGGSVEAGLNHILAPLGLDVATLRARPEGVRVPLEQRYRKYREKGFDTETGKAEFYSELLQRHGYAPVPCFTPPAEAPSPTFPLVLFSVNSGYFCHSQHRGINALRRRHSEPTAEIHPSLADVHEIAEGDWILVRTRLGAIRVRAALNDTLAPDTVACDYGWWQAAPDLGLPGYPTGTDEPIGSNYNALVSDSMRDRISGALPLRSFACSVERHERRSWRGWRPFVVTARHRETQDVSSFTLAPADGALLPAFRPGQFVGLRMEGATRSYSLINAGRPPPSAYRIAVRRVEGGNVSDAMVRRLAVGDRIDLQAPGGSFTMPERNEFPLVLIAGGIGITPFLSYLETLTGSTTEPQVFLHHVCRDAAHQPFAIRLATLTRALPNVSMITHLTRPQLGDRFDYAGRFSVVRIDNALIRSRARFFICATDAMMEEVTAALRARGVPPFEIFQERFRSPQPMPVSDCTQHRIHFTSTGHVLTWTPAAGSILDLAEVAGISMRSGCRVGQCESCAVKLRSGTVRHMIECPDVEGQCLTCLAIPTSDLVIEA